MDDLDTPYLAARMNGLLKRFLDNFYEVMEILLENTLPENRLFPTNKHTIGSEQAEYMTSPSNAEEYDEKREAMEVQCIKKFLRDIDHDGVRAELNDILYGRENDALVLEMIFKFYKWPEDTVQKWMSHKHTERMDAPNQRGRRRSKKPSNAEYHFENPSELRYMFSPFEPLQKKVMDVGQSFHGIKPYCKDLHEGTTKTMQPPSNFRCFQCGLRLHPVPK
jgi:hypothetical protein